MKVRFDDGESKPGAALELSGTPDLGVVTLEIFEECESEDGKEYTDSISFDIDVKELLDAIRFVCPPEMKEEK